jgi:hypothetical protein
MRLNQSRDQDPEDVRPIAKQAFCTRGMPNRECYGIPDDATCTAVFDQAWTERRYQDRCLHEGPAVSRCGFRSLKPPHREAKPSVVQ